MEHSDVFQCSEPKDLPEAVNNLKQNRLKARRSRQKRTVKSNAWNMDICYMKPHNGDTGKKNAWKLQSHTARRIQQNKVPARWTDVSDTQSPLPTLDEIETENSYANVWKSTETWSPSTVEALNAVLHLSTHTLEERELLLSLMPPSLERRTSLNAVMTGRELCSTTLKTRQVNVNEKAQEATKTDFDPFIEPGHSTDFLTTMDSAEWDLVIDWSGGASSVRY